MSVMLIRTVLLYFLLVAAIRLMGKRQIGEMEPAEFVVTMLLANLAAAPMQDVSVSLVSAAVPILTVLALELILAVLTLKFLPVRTLLCGKPAILIQNGKIEQRALTENRVSMDELTEQLREKDVFDLRAVKYAILETDGELSVLLEPTCKPASAKDSGITPSPALLPYTVISDGKLLKDNLRLSGFDRPWLEKQLKKAAACVRDVFLLTVDASGSVNLIKKERK